MSNIESVNLVIYLIVILFFAMDNLNKQGQTIYIYTDLYFEKLCESLNVLIYNLIY